MESTGRPTRRRSPQVRAEQLLDAATTVLLEHGLAATTVADVAEAAGVAKGTLYLYFDSKDALLAALRARYLRSFAEAINPAVTSGRASPGTRLDRFVDGLFEFSQANHDLHHLLFHEAGFSESDALAGGRAILASLIDDGLDAGAFKVKDSSVAAGYLLHGLHGLLVDAMHSDSADVGRYQAAARDLARRTVTA